MNTQERYFHQLAATGHAVVDRRLQLEMSQAALANAAGVDAKTLRSLERGERWPQDTSRVKIERVLGWEDGTLGALFSGDFLWTEVDQPDGSRSGGLVYVREPDASASRQPSAASSEDAVDSHGIETPAGDLSASELAALLVTRSQSLERRVRQLESERDQLRDELESMPHRQEQDDDDNDPASVGSEAQPDGVTPGERRRVLQRMANDEVAHDGGEREVNRAPRGTVTEGSLSDMRPRLLGGEDPRILELPYAADADHPDDDPGEDDD